jgi:hypothetical protein
VTGRPVCEVKPTCPSFRHRRRHFRIVQTEQPTAVAIWVSFQPAAAYSTLLQAHLKYGRLSWLHVTSVRRKSPVRTSNQIACSLLTSEMESKISMHSPAHLHKGEASIVHSFLTSIKRLTSTCFQSLQQSFVDWTKPSRTSLTVGTVTDLVRSKSELVAENALLRQQLIILRRQVKRPALRKADRFLLVLLARMVRAWKQALFIVQPETLLRWHRQGFKLYWR